MSWVSVVLMLFVELVSVVSLFLLMMSMLMVVSSLVGKVCVGVVLSIIWMLVVCVCCV